MITVPDVRFVFSEDVTAQDVLDRAYLIINQYDICRGAYATDEDGHDVYTDSPEATAFDSSGAIYRAASDLGLSSILNNGLYIEAFSIFQTFVQAHYFCPALVSWGDRVSDDEIREMFRRISSPHLVGI